MSYCTFEDVAMLVGASPVDFEYLGEPMTLPEFKTMVEGFIVFAEGIIHKYCNVTTFNLHNVEGELHTVGNLEGRSTLSGYSSPLVYGISDMINDFDDTNRRIMLREYPVSSVTNVNVSYTHPLGKKVWTHVDPITDEHGGQYEVVKRFLSTYILLGYNMPRYGVNNVKVDYIAGYPIGHEVFSQLKLAVAMVVKNILNYKKSSQEIYTIRGSSVQSYASMFAGTDNSIFISVEVRAIIDKWRRPYNTPDAYV